MNFKINTFKEKSLHRQLKNWYAVPSDLIETPFEGKVVDIKRGEQIIEIQTQNLSALKSKIELILKKTTCHLTIVYPLSKETTIITLNSKGIEVRRRKSPKSLDYFQIFREIVGISNHFLDPRLTLEVVIIKQLDIRCDDGNGSYHRKGVSLVDRELLSVESALNFKIPSDFKKLLPLPLPSQFTNIDFKKYYKLNYSTTSKTTYCLRKLGLIEIAGKKGRSLHFKVVE